MLLVCLFQGSVLIAQVRDTVLTTDSISVSLRGQVPDSLIGAESTDSLPFQTRPADYRVSEDALTSVVDYNSEDSMRFDYDQSVVHLFGNAVVRYQSFTLEADYIVFNLDSSIAIAQGFPDSSGTLAGFPVFDHDGQSFTSDKLRYNFATQRGMIYDARTEQADLTIHGTRTKFIAGGSDSLHQEDHIYSKGAIITTCDAPVPHFGIRASKIKTIPNRLAVIGPSNLEIQGVPTPLWLPFGFFPVTSSRRSGLIFPQDYEFSEAWGFGLRNIGYYFPISEYIDARVLGDIYFNGSWSLGVQSTYRKRYKYNGSINLGYSVRKNEVAGELDPTVQKSYSIRIAHNQDPKAHPYRRFGGSINIQTNDYQSLNQNDANSVLTSVYTSNFSWSRSFPGKPYSLSISLNHSQNTRTKVITIDAPNIDLRLNRIYPFKSKKRIGEERWYERIGFQYSGNAKSKFVTTDSTIFTQEMWDNAQYGVQHRLNTDMSFTLGKFFHFTPSMSYDDTWFFKSIDKEFLFDPNDTNYIRQDTLFDAMGNMIIVPDTVSYGDVMDNTNYGFKQYQRFSSGISMTTQIFGTVQFRKGWLRGLRHVMKPAISFSYTPDIYDKFRDSVQVDIRRPDPEDWRDYSILEGGLYSAPLTNGDQIALGYSLNNIFEAKIFNKKDGEAKKIKIFDNLILSGNYNFAADSLNFSPMNIRGTLRFLKGASNLQLGATYDFYEIDANGRRYNKFAWETPGQLLRFDMFQARLSTRLTIGKIKEFLSREPQQESTGTDEDEVSRDQSRSRGNSSQGRPSENNVDIFFDLFNGFSIDHNIAVVVDGRRDTTMITTHTINMRGSLQLTKKWSINIGNIGYDFRAKNLTYPDIGFTRDLHCWSLTMSWQPQRGTYALQIGVKPGSLDFIKVPHNRNQQDTFGGF